MIATPESRKRIFHCFAVRYFTFRVATSALLHHIVRRQDTLHSLEVNTNKTSAGRQRSCSDDCGAQARQ